MATSRATLGAIFAAVQQTASTAVTAVSTINDSLSMVTTIVDDAKARQAVRSKWDRKHYAETYANEKAKEIIEQRIEIKAWLKDHDDMVDEFNQLLADMKDPAPTK